MRARLIAAAAALGVILAACNGDSPGASGTPTPGPAPTLDGRLLYEDTFFDDEDAGRWNPNDSEDTSSSFTEDGRLRLVLKAQGVRAQKLVRLSAFEIGFDGGGSVSGMPMMAVETDAAVTGGSTLNTVFVACMFDDSNGYMLGIGSDGQWEISNINSEGRGLLASGKVSPPTQPMRVAGECISSRSLENPFAMRLSVNGEEVGSVRDDTGVRLWSDIDAGDFTAAGVAINARASNPPSDPLAAEFSAFRLYDIDEFSAPEPSPRAQAS